MMEHNSRFAPLRQPLLPDTLPSEPASPQPRTSISPRLLSAWALVAAIGATCSAGAALVMLLSDPNQQLPGATVAVDDEGILIFGQGGVYWSNGSRALATDGMVSWACALDAPALFNGSRDALVLVSETTNELLAWQPGSSTVLRAPLSRLAAPVSCVQSGPLLYVACFGVEDEPGRSGLAVLDAAASSWAVVKEVMVGTHVHSLHARDGHLLFADVGDPWAAPPRVRKLGGLRRVAAGLAGAVSRVGPPMHARMVAFVPRQPTFLTAPSAAAWPANGSGSIRRHAGDGPARRSSSSSTIEGLGGIGAGGVGDGGVDAYVVTQEPLGEATRVAALSAQSWAGFFIGGADGDGVGGGAEGKEGEGGDGGDGGDGDSEAVEVGSMALPVPAKPSDGGADVFVMPRGGDGEGAMAVGGSSSIRSSGRRGSDMGGSGRGGSDDDDDDDERVYVTDRYLGGGRLFALRGGGGGGGGGASSAASALDVVGSVALGAHPRYTDPLGSPSLIWSVSRDDGILTTVHARTLRVLRRAPAHVALPSFLARWPPPRGGAAPTDAAMRRR